MSTDRSGALEMFSLHKDTLSDVENVLVDGGYSGEPFAYGYHCFCRFIRKTVLRELLDKINHHRAHTEHRGRSYGLLSSSRRV
jgi:hypothetical protein